jgi:membrane protein DedA with SNARE-associated domain
MPFAQFLFYSSIGAVIWAGVYGTLGYIFGSNLPALERAIGRTSFIVLVIVVLAGTLLYLSRKKRSPAEPT